MLRKQGDYSGNSHNDHTGNQGFTAPFDESGSDFCQLSKNDGSDASSVMSDELDEEMQDMSKGQEV